jgi:hypothetical protein
MTEQSNQNPQQKRPQEQYSEPLLLKHEPLRDITGQKYGEKTGTEKGLVEKDGAEV